MFVVFCFLILQVSVEAFDQPRVSRMKPAYVNHQPEGRTRFPPVPTQSQEMMSSDLVKPPVTDQFPRKTLPTVTSVVKREEMLCEKPYSCTNCTAYKLCIPSQYGLVQIYSGVCPNDRPYCDNYSGTCVNSVAAAVKCAEPDDSFHCMQDGHFPHPADPAKYYICSDLKAYGYSCKEGLKYYAPSQGCSKFPWLVNPFDCSDLNATKVLYNNGGSFYAYCIDGKSFLINKCLENEFFNSTSQVCEPHCNKDFISADPNNCRSYFKCYRNPNTKIFEKYLIDCPSGEGFNGTLNKCVPVNQLSNCLN